MCLEATKFEVFFCLIWFFANVKKFFPPKTLKKILFSFLEENLGRHFQLTVGILLSGEVCCNKEISEIFSCYIALKSLP